MTKDNQTLLFHLIMLSVPLCIEKTPVIDFSITNLLTFVPFIECSSAKIQDTANENDISIKS